MNVVRNNMTQQREVNPNMRAILVDWLVEVAEEYNLSSDTLYLCVNYVDRYLAQASVSRRQLQLLGITCMLIAAKYEEISCPSLEEFIVISDSTYSKEEVPSSK